MKLFYALDPATGRCIATIAVDPKDEPAYMAQPSSRYTDLPKPACPPGYEARHVAGAWACYPCE